MVKKQMTSLNANAPSVRGTDNCMVNIFRSVESRDMIIIVYNQRTPMIYCNHNSQYKHTSRAVKGISWMFDKIPFLLTSKSRDKLFKQ